MGVTRERVRQWQMKLLPDAPRGHERQRLCAVYRKKRRLLEEPLFRRFYQQARAHLTSGRIELIRAHDGYRTRSVRIDQRVIVLSKARMLPSRGVSDDSPAYLLAAVRGAVDYAYYRLTADDYLLVPASEVPVDGTTFVDRPGMPLRRYRNTFDALLPEARLQSA
jgi:hypothetical protein